MLPRVILHNAVSADGRTTGFSANQGLFHRLASSWDEDVTLAGSDTILAALRQGVAEAEPTETAPAPVNEGNSRLAVIDSRGRIKDWRRIKAWPFWSNFVSIGTGGTPDQHLAYLRYQEVDDLVAGDKHVDLEQALEELSNRYDARTVRVESGGTLNAALLRRGLADEVSLIVHPIMVGGMSPHTVYKTVDLDIDTPVDMKLTHCEMLDGSYAWLRYEVVR